MHDKKEEAAAPQHTQCKCIDAVMFAGVIIYYNFCFAP